MSVDELITAVAQEVQQQLTALYETVEPVPDSALDQNGLRDGADIVKDYLSHGETGVAYDHLLYMITEPDLTLSDDAYSQLHRATDILGLPREALTSIRRATGG